MTSALPDSPAAPAPARERTFSAERLALYRLVWQAFRMRDTPYLVDAAQAIVDWHEQCAYDRLAEDERKDAAAIAFLRWRPGV
jgi:hypothetical protein